MAGTNETRHWSEEKHDFSSASFRCQGRDSYGEYHIQNVIREVSLAYNTQTVLVTVHSRLKNQACTVESIDSLISHFALKFTARLTNPCLPVKAA